MSKNYLTFKLNDTIYAIPVLQVREVLDYKEPQELPCPDPVIAGLIRSRGQSISVINLRRKFAFPDADPTKETRIIVVEVDSISENSNTEGQIVFGAIVDSVNEVIEMDASLEEPTPEVGSSIAADFISGIGRQDDAFVIILNIDKAFTFEEINPVLASELSQAEVSEEEPEETDTEEQFEEIQQENPVEESEE